MIAGHPYRYISDDVLFTVHADRKVIPKARTRAVFSKGQACLRASALGKTYGWGIHMDARGRVALCGMETKQDQEFSSGKRRGADGGRR
jgi:hypothetical protein